MRNEKRIFDDTYLVAGIFACAICILVPALTREPFIRMFQGVEMALPAPTLFYLYSPLLLLVIVGLILGASIALSGTFLRGRKKTIMLGLLFMLVYWFIGMYVLSISIPFIPLINLGFAMIGLPLGALMVLSSIFLRGRKKTIIVGLLLIVTIILLCLIDMSQRAAELYH